MKPIPLERSDYSGTISSLRWAVLQLVKSANNNSITPQIQRFDLKKYEYNDIIKNCSIADWDGYDALPLKEQSIKNCIKLINLLPEKISLPDLSPEPDGILGMEWRKNGYFISCGISENGILTWGGIAPFGDLHGREEFLNIIPEKFLFLLHLIEGHKLNVK